MPSEPRSRAEVLRPAEGPERRVHLVEEAHVLRERPALVATRLVRPAGPDRPPVLLVHGFAQNRLTWDTSHRSWAAWLAERGWDAWNLELRGHGRSRELGGPPGAARFADYVDDVLAAADALPARAFWLGHSLGGTALYAAAARRPDAPLGVATVGALYRFGRANRWIGAVARLSRLATGGPLGALAPRVHVRTRLAGALLARAGAAGDLMAWALPVSGWWPGSVEPELLRERLVAGFDWTSVAVWREMAGWSAAGLPPFDAEWRRAAVPVLVVLGDRDQLVPTDDGRAAVEHAGGEDRTLLLRDAWETGRHWGHLDLVLGRAAPEHVWAPVEAWMEARRC